MVNPIGNTRGRVIFSALLGALFLAAIVYFFLWRQSSELQPLHQQQYRIGGILPLSGSLGFMGKMEGDGMQLSVEDINTSGGINGRLLKLMIDDSQGKPDIAVTAAQKMMTVDGISLIISSFSSVTLGLKPIIERNNGILIGACMHPDFYKNAPNVFRFYIGVEDESQSFVEYLTGQKTVEGILRIGCLYVEAPNILEQLENYIEPGLSEAGLRFTVKEPYRLSEKEFRDKILKLRAADLTHLLIIGYGFLYPNIFREMKDQQLLGKIKIVGGWGFLYPNVSEKDLEGVVVVGPSYVFKQDERVIQFYRRFSQRFGYQANFDAAMTYAMMQVLAEGIRQSRSIETADLIVTLKSLNEISTIVGNISIGMDGEMLFPVGIGKFHEGKIINFDIP